MAKQHNELTLLPNIGKTLADTLNLVGIETANQLKSVGAENAFIKIVTVDSSACINMLFAIEGAIQGIRWHSLSNERKQELKEFFRMVSK